MDDEWDIYVRLNKNIIIFQNIISLIDDDKNSENMKNKNGMFIMVLLRIELSIVNLRQETRHYNP